MAPIIVSVQRRDELQNAVQSNGISLGRPVLVAVGGARGFDESVASSMAGFFTEQLCPALDRWGAAAVDGGTDSGVMRLLGQARHDSGAGFPLVGVAATGTVRGGDGASQDAVELEPNHTLAVLVPGHEWGDETPWIVDVATTVAGGRGSATLFVNGGGIALADAAASLAAGRPLLVLRGSGRAADDIAAARDGNASEAGPGDIAAYVLTRVVSLDRPAELLSALEDLLSDR